MFSLVQSGFCISLKLREVLIPWFFLPRAREALVLEDRRRDEGERRGLAPGAGQTAQQPATQSHRGHVQLQLRAVWAPMPHGRAGSDSQTPRTHSRAPARGRVRPEARAAVPADQSAREADIGHSFGRTADCVSAWDLSHPGRTVAAHIAHAACACVCRRQRRIVASDGDRCRDSRVCQHTLPPACTDRVQLAARTMHGFPALGREPCVRGWSGARAWSERPIARSRGQTVTDSL